MKKALFAIVLLLGVLLIFSACAKKYHGTVGEPIDVTIQEDTENVTQFQWAFKKKPAESRLDPRDFEPSDYAEAVTFVPDVPGTYEVIVVMIDETGKETDESFIYEVTLAGEVVEEAPEVVEEEPVEPEKPAEVAEEETWEPAPEPTAEQKKSFKPPVSKPAPDVSAQEAANRIPSDKSRYTIQVSSWTSYKTAQKAMKDLQDAGFDAYIQNAYLSHTDKVWYRVRVGNFTNRADARKVAEQIKDKTGQDTWIDYMRKDY
ncbi:SPOR domain-containing protein [Fidelibacter multiformis]|uniref:SPOR domain-containing protein n=1 Tax=Fidelibacter multiformis TaxID=3377529 RepID=UPI0037DCFCD6